MMFPECASSGTVTTSPAAAWCSRAPGEALLMRAPGECGNAISIPEAIPLPAITSVPWVETSCACVEHLLDG